MQNELKDCPLCHSKSLQIDNDGIYKPEIVCNQCGIALQAETVNEAIDRWNERSDIHHEQQCDLCDQAEFLLTAERKRIVKDAFETVYRKTRNATTRTQVVEAMNVVLREM